MDLVRNANSNSELAGLSISSTQLHKFTSITPILATPAAAMAGIAVGSAVVAAVGGGVAVGEAID